MEFVGVFFFQAEDGMRDLGRSRGLGDVYKRQALRVLRDLVTRHPKVLQDPAPMIGIAGFADSSITLSIRPWVQVAAVGTAHSELNQAIIQRLQADGVDIPFPQREVRLLNPS